MGCTLVGVGCAVVDTCGATDVDFEGSVAGLLGNTSKTTGTTTAADAAATSAIVACLVRYHGCGGALNVNPQLFEAMSWPFTVQVLTVGDGTRWVGGKGGRATSRGAA